MAKPKHGKGSKGGKPRRGEPTGERRGIGMSGDPTFRGERRGSQRTGAHRDVPRTAIGRWLKGL